MDVEPPVPEAIGENDCVGDSICMKKNKKIVCVVSLFFFALSSPVSLAGHPCYTQTDGDPEAKLEAKKKKKEKKVPSRFHRHFFSGVLTRFHPKATGKKIEGGRAGRNVCSKRRRRRKREITSPQKMLCAEANPQSRAYIVLCTSKKKKKKTEDPSGFPPKNKLGTGGTLF